MKQKMIEQMPYLSCKPVENQSYPYIAVSAIRMIGKVRHLIVDIYRNHREEMERPVMRLAYTKDDWGLYWPERTGSPAKWSRGRLREGYRNRWDYDNSMKYKHDRTYIAEEDAERVRRFAGFTGGREEWTYALCRHEEKIICARKSKAYHNKITRCEERNRDVPELPGAFTDWYKNVLFANENFLYYKRHNRTADITCSNCGESYTIRIRQSGDDGEQAEEAPRDKVSCRCGKCGAVGRYKPAGRIRGVYGLSKACYVGQQYRENGAVIRYIEIEKILSQGEPADYIVNEIVRNFFEPEKEKKIQRDYHLQSNWTGTIFWSPTNLSGYYSIQQKEASVFPGTYECLRQTYLKYSAVEEFARQNEEKIQLADYLEAYIRHPCLEYIVKAGLNLTAVKVVKGYLGEESLDETARNPADLFRIRRDRMRIFIDRKGDPELLRLLQYEKRGGYQWDEEMINKLLILHLGTARISEVLEYMTIRQYLNRVEKYAGADWEGCADAQKRLEETGIFYLDYLNMRQQLGYDMTNTVYLFPKDLEREHHKMATEVNKKRREELVTSKNVQFPDIKKYYRRLRNQYYYEDDRYLIRPARSAGEIVEEGQILHHCVGGDNYLAKHNEGQTYILMLRRREQPDIPYITVEIEAGSSYRIIQWYGTNDRKPDEGKIQPWLNDYINRIKCQGQQGNQHTDQQAGEQLIQYA